MFIRTAMIPLAACLALVAALQAAPLPQAAPSPQAAPAQEAAPQDVTALLQELQKSIGKEVPRSIRITAAGSGYKAGSGDARVHYRIEPHTLDIDASSPDALGTPVGFLASALAAKATLTTETLFGTPYKVISFTAANGQQVRGYVTDQNVLERIRTEAPGGKGKTPVEVVFFSWQDFNGVRFPSVMIQKEHDQVQRILVVSQVESAGAPAPTNEAANTKPS